MEKLVKGIRIAAFVAEIIVASSVMIELAEKYGGRFRKKSAASSKVAVDNNTATEN